MDEVQPARVDREELRCQIQAKYTDVAVEPEKGFHFHTGRPLANMLGYATEDVNGLPESAVASFAGTGNPFSYLPGLLRRPVVRRVLGIDFLYWFAFAIFQTTFALFVARRFGFDATHTGYFLAAFGMLGAVIQGGLIRPIVRRLGDKPTFMIGLVCAAVGLSLSAFTHSVTIFAMTLVPVAFGIGFGHPTMSSLVSQVARGDEQGRVQGAASAVESLGRTIGPVWGSASLQHLSESTPYASAALVLLLTLLLSVGFHVSESNDEVKLSAG